MDVLGLNSRRGKILASFLLSAVCFESTMSLFHFVYTLEIAAILKLLFSMFQMAAVTIFAVNIIFFLFRAELPEDKKTPEIL